MANKNIKALVIKVNSSSEPAGIEYNWDSLTSRMPTFTKEIVTPALSVDKDLANTKRHPTVEDNVVIYSGATILGGETTIGTNSIIGGNVWLTKSVPANSTVYHRPEIKVVENEATH